MAKIDALFPNSLTFLRFILNFQPPPPPSWIFKIYTHAHSTLILFPFLGLTILNSKSNYLLIFLYSRAEQKEARKIEKEAKEEIKKVEKEAANKNGEVKEVNADTAAKNGEFAKKNVDSKSEKPKETEKPKEEEKKEEFKDKATPLCPRPTQNWSDFFFIIDSLSYNIDMCDLILFMTKICPVSGIDNKKVNVDISYLDTSSNTLIVSHTDAGIIENLLGI